MSADDRRHMSVMLTCKDVSRAARFYRDVCGFEMKESWPNSEEPQWANMVLGGQSVMIGAPPKLEDIAKMCQGDAVEEAFWTKSVQAFESNDAGVGVQVYLQVPDVDAYATELRERGATVEGEPKTQFYGIRELRLVDPEGYGLTFFSSV